MEARLNEEFSVVGNGVNASLSQDKNNSFIDNSIDISCDASATVPDEATYLNNSECSSEFNVCGSSLSKLCVENSSVAITNPNEGQSDAEGKAETIENETQPQETFNTVSKFVNESTAAGNSTVNDSNNMVNTVHIIEEALVDNFNMEAIVDETERTMHNSISNEGDLEKISTVLTTVTGNINYSSDQNISNDLSFQTVLETCSYNQANNVFSESVNTLPDQQDNETYPSRKNENKCDTFENVSSSSDAVSHDCCTTQPVNENRLECDNEYDKNGRGEIRHNDREETGYNDKEETRYTLSVSQLSEEAHIKGFDSETNKDKIGESFDTDNFSVNAIKSFYAKPHLVEVGDEAVISKGLNITDEDNPTKVLAMETSALNLILSACSLMEKHSRSRSSSLSDVTFTEGDIKQLEDILGSNIDASASCLDDGIFTNNAQELFKSIRGAGMSLSLDDKKILGYSELEKNLYSSSLSSLGLDSIIRSTVSETGLELQKDMDLQDQLLSLDSDSNMATASEGVVSSCSPSASSETSQQVSEASNGHCSLGFLPEISQDSSLEEGQGSSEEREGYGKRGDADGCSLSNSDDANAKGADVAQSTFHAASPPNFEQKTGTENQADVDSNCACQRPDVIPHEENGSVLLGAWNELRSSLRQLHRSVVPSSVTKSGLSNPRNRPSINRIKALSNMLLAHDPHQLFTRVNQLSQELCIELKVRLLATIHDKPDFDEACTFIQGLCESYEWVINVCEAIQSAFEKLDSEHLSRFGLNWMTVNMHTFYTTIFTDPDVQDYLSVCNSKAEEFVNGKETLGRLASLKRTLTVAEGVWSKAENCLQEYAMERTALNAQRRHFFSEWGQAKNRHPAYGKYPVPKYQPPSFSTDARGSMESTGSHSSITDNVLQQCPCDICHTTSATMRESVGFSAEASDKGQNVDTSSNDSGGICECHFCNSAVQVSNSSSSTMLSSVSSRNLLPPLTQPQLSLYPHIHGTSVGTDIVSNQVLDDLGPLPGTASSKPPIFANPYLGSDLLTEQLIREWDLVYGDTLTPPGSLPMSSTTPRVSADDVTLANSLEKLSLSGRPSYARQMGLSQGSLSSDQITAHGQTSPIHHHSKGSVSSSVTTAEEVPAPHQSGTAARGDGPSPSMLEAQSKCQKQQLPTVLPKQQTSSSVITHTKNCKGESCIAAVKPSCANAEQLKHRMALRSSERSSSQESPFDIDSTDPDEWSSSDETDTSSSASSLTHQGSHCDCCYCHMLQNMPGGGRQKYSDRRERLLKILSHKKKTSGSACGGGSADNEAEGHRKEKDDAMGQQTVDEIMNYIEGKRSSSKCLKKAAKKARQKERKMEIKRQEEHQKKIPKSYRHENEYDDDDDDVNPDGDEYYDEESEELIEEEEEDGPLAELRRRAPDVTITVVKPGQQNLKGIKSQLSSSREQQTGGIGGSKHPLVAKPLSSAMAQNNNTWTPPRTVLPSGKTTSSLAEEKEALSSGSSSAGGLSSLLRGMESLSKDQDQDGKSSQMVTIRRVMDPISSEPTVTITLKGDEPKKDKVLFKLVNGQACPGDGITDSNGQKKNSAAKVKQPQEKPVYDIPEGTSPEEAKKLKKKQKKERQKQRKEIEKLEEQKREQLKQLQLRKQQEYLKQQEEQIKKQQATLKRQQDELTRQQAKGQSKNSKKKGKKGNGNAKESSAKGKSVSAMVYDGDDVARNFSLPPGVSINKVAGQPGMVTISNNMGNPFAAQPFIPSAGMYTSPVMQSYGNSQAFSVGSPSSVVGFPGMYGGCGPNIPWNSAIDPCTGTPQESVIVVDTKSGTTNAKSCSKYNGTSSECFKTFDEMTSEEKIEAAVRGEIDVSLLNQTQKKKYKKFLKTAKEEEENAIQKQKEEDELMDRMYQMAKRKVTDNSVNGTKNNKKLKNKGKESKVISSQNCVSGSGVKTGQTAKTKKQNQTSSVQSTGKTKTMSQKGNEKVGSKTEVKIASSSRNLQDQQKQILNQQQRKLHSQQKLLQTKKQIESQQKTQLKQQQQQPTQSKQQQLSQLKPQPAQQQTQSQPLQRQTQSQPLQRQTQSQPLQRQTQSQPLQRQNQRQQKQNQSRQLGRQPEKPHSQQLTLSDRKQQQQQSQNQPTKAYQQNQKQQQQSHQKVQQLHSQPKQQINYVQQSSTHQKQEQQQKSQQRQQSKQQVQQPHQKEQCHQQKQKQQPKLHNKIGSGADTHRGHFNHSEKGGTQGMRLQPNFGGSLVGGDNANMYPYGPSLGYAVGDYGHEARYAQYLAANASTLASVESESSHCPKAADHMEDCNQKKGKKRGKKGHLEDMTTIDSVFTPKDGPGGELDDETDREVEAFKRFCLYNVPRSSGEKPKVNFNVKDIMIKKKH